MGCFGSVVLLKQLELFGVNIEPLQDEDGVKNELLAILFELYGINGDCIAKQYAGSEAFHKATLIEAENGNWKTQKQNYTFLALKRYISNTLLDNEKQKAISLFLGDFLPNINDKKHIWDLDLKEFNEHMLIDAKNPFSNYQEKNQWWIGKDAVSPKDFCLFKRNAVEMLDKTIKDNDTVKIHLKLESIPGNGKKNNEGEIFARKNQGFSICDKGQIIKNVDFEEEAFQKINATYKTFLNLEKNVVFLIKIC